MRRIALWGLGTVSVVTLLFGHRIPADGATTAAAVSISGSAVGGTASSTGASRAEAASFAVPRPITEADAAGAVTVDMVSGATYTSAGYRTSIQSALDEAGRAA